MNKALNIKNWNQNGNSYVLKGNPKNKWVGFQETVLTNLSNLYGHDFNIVIWTDADDENDYYCIPYTTVKNLFIDEHKTTGKYPNRWTAIILEHQFLMHSNSKLGVDISKYYGTSLFPISKVNLDEDYFIENIKREINIRIGQSKFRNGVLENFNGKCALSGITEKSLLTASHIIPWADNKYFRGDISNGICLYCEYDMLFDRGIISFTDELEIIIISDQSNISNSLKEKLKNLEGKGLMHPVKKPINPTYLEYHRTHIFNKINLNSSIVPVSPATPPSNYYDKP